MVPPKRAIVAVSRPPYKLTINHDCIWESDLVQGSSLTIFPL